MNKIRASLAWLCISFQLISCGSGSGDSAATCQETGPYACKTGATEPLYAYQWALNSVKSFFADYLLVSDGATDLNVEDVHSQGIKGQGVNILVLDDGLEINHVDLKDNVSRSMTWNFETNDFDPTPTSKYDAHGTLVAGIVAAAQNGVGVMGVAPRVTLGGAKFLALPEGIFANVLEAYGGASWSKSADIFNASYLEVGQTPPSYDSTNPETAALESFPNLRGGKGAVMIKAAGNAFRDEYDGKFNAACPRFQKGGATYGIVSCGNTAFDTQNLELPVVVTASGNAKGYKASYSSAGAILWITGLGGESRSNGNYGESGKASDAHGPQIYSTDLMGCDRGYSRDGISSKYNPQFVVGGTLINKEKNTLCNYDQTNGTSAAVPTVTGVVALMLSANPSLGWRDIREILRRTARTIDIDYGNRDYRNHKVNLILNPTIADETSSELIVGATSARLDYGWQTNKAGIQYSNWYGFGMVDAKAAVAMAKSYTTYKPTKLVVPTWTNDAIRAGVVNYGQVTQLGSFSVSNPGAVDMIQLDLSAVEGGADVCMGSVGIFLKSPSGTMSVLNTPYNIYYDKTTSLVDERDGGKISSESDFVLGSYAFYGESGKGTWTVYAVSGTPLPVSACASNPKLNIGYRIYTAE